MEIKLPIYNKKELVKTYTVESYDVTFGTVEDLIGVIDLDNFTSGKDEDLIRGVALALPKVFGLIKPLLKDIFDGLTDDEIKKCRMTDITKALVAVIKFSVAQIMDSATSKN